MFSKLYN